MSEADGIVDMSDIGDVLTAKSGCLNSRHKLLTFSLVFTIIFHSTMI